MTEKRYLLKYDDYETSGGDIIEIEPYYIDTKGEYIDDDYFTIDGYPTMSDKQVVDLLNKQEEIIQIQKDYLIRMGHGTIFEKMKQQEERIKELEKENENYRQILLDFGIKSILRDNNVLKDGDIE